MDEILITIKEQAGDLFKKSFAECLRIRDETLTLRSADQNEQNRIAIAKKNLMDSAQLAGQIIRALDGGSLLLALIGLKSLVESLINTKYTFAHPSKKDQIQWAYKVCKDYFERGNDPIALKSKLNETAVAKRAKQVGLEEIYEKTYGGLCNYDHMLVHTGLLNTPQKFRELTRDCYVTTLTVLHDIRCDIQKHFNASVGEGDLHQQIILFRDTYPEASPC